MSCTNKFFSGGVFAATMPGRSEKDAAVDEGHEGKGISSMTQHTQ